MKKRHKKFRDVMNDFDNHDGVSYENDKDVLDLPKELEHKKTIFQEAKDLFNVDKVKRAFRLGSDLLEAVYPVIEKPTWITAAKSAFSIGKIIVDDLEVWSDGYFDESWAPMFSMDFNKIVLKALSKMKYKTIKTSERTRSIRIVECENLKFGYIFNSQSEIIDCIFAEAEKLQESREKIKHLLWSFYKDSNLIMRCNRRSSLARDESRIVFESDNVFEPMPSKRAKEYSTYLKKCLDAGVSRSVMLYGPPGTGKSTMARTVVDSLGLRSFRIRVEDVSGIETSTIFEAIEIFQPDAVIIDDFDRSHAQTALLEILEFFQHKVKLVIATVNDRNKLDEAILRPGRFDELLQIKKMDEDVVKILLGKEFADSFETVKEWPIAFIQEYTKRRKFMTSEEAEESTRELAMRVKRLEIYEDSEEDEGVSSVISKKKQRKMSVKM